MKAVIIGAGAQGRVVLDVLRSSKDYDEFEFLDDNSAGWQKPLNNVLVKGSIDLIRAYDKNNFRTVLALGNPISRRKVANDPRLLDSPFLNAIHSSAFIAASSELGSGNTICAQAVVNSNTVLGNHVLVNNGAIVEHDCIVADFVTVAPGARIGGRVNLQDSCFVSTGAIILARCTVGKGSIVAAGALVTRDVPDNCLVMGSPARVRQEIDADFNWSRLL